MIPCQSQLNAGSPALPCTVTTLGDWEVRLINLGRVRVRVLRINLGRRRVVITMASFC